MTETRTADDVAREPHPIGWLFSAARLPTPTEIAADLDDERETCR